MFGFISNLLGGFMNIREIDISINTKHPILFSHIMDHPMFPSVHSLHLHDYVEIYIYISGDVDFIVEENYIALKKGDIIITTPNVLHRPIIKSSKEYERYYIGIPFDAFSFIDRGSNPISFVSENKTLFSVNSIEFKHILSILNQISQIISNKNNNDIYLAYSYFLQFLSSLNLAFNTKKIDIETRTNDVPALINDILKYIDTHPSVNSVKELADVFHVNPSYLSTLFSDSTHITLKQYLTTKKIAEAKNLLSKDISLSEIAYECGFSSCSHFITVFKHVTGKTPREYRKEIK